VSTTRMGEGGGAIVAAVEPASERGPRPALRGAAWTNVMWALAAVYLAVILITSVSDALSPGVVSVLALTSLTAAAVVHGLTLYRARDVVVFYVLTFLVSNFFENLSIITGFPFGHYQYTLELGPRLFHVPLVIGPFYVAAGYMSWVLALALLRVWNKRLRGWTTVLVPLIAGVLMVAWDVCIDPSDSTIHGQWTREHGGGYFGVPLVNYAGWFLTVMVFYLVFAAYLRVGKRSGEHSGAARAAGREQAPALPKAFWYQAAVLYFGMGLARPLLALTTKNEQVRDNAGHLWATADIYQSLTLVTVFTMWTFALLAAVTIAREDRGDL